MTQTLKCPWKMFWVPIFFYNTKKQVITWKNFMRVAPRRGKRFHIRDEYYKVLGIV